MTKSNNLGLMMGSTSGQRRAKKHVRKFSGSSVYEAYGSVTYKSRVTSKGQITIPKFVRNHLRLSDGDDVRFRIEGDHVIMEAKKDETDDPAIAAFLNLLEQDIATRPNAVSEIPPQLMEKMQLLTAGIEVDLDAPIDEDVDL